MKNSKKTKRTLLYSALALILCFTMLLGTTFAWFTDTASTAVNKIQAGTLDIELLDKNGDTLEGKTLSWQKAAGHEDEAVLWEPGASYNLEAVTIKNNGNLALKYKIVITGIDGDAKLNEVIDWTVEVGDETYDAGEDISLAVDESNVLTISGKMQTTAGNEYQGLSIDGVAITVYATQDTVEYDSTTNQYDKDAEYAEEVSDENELREAIKSGNSGVVVLEEDINLTGVNGGHGALFGKSVISTEVTVDANGKKITNSTTTGNNSDYNMLFYVGSENGNNGDLTITGNGVYEFNESVDNGKYPSLVYARHNATVTIENGTFNANAKNAVAVWATNNAVVTINGGKFVGDGSSDLIYANGSGKIYITGGFFSNGDGTHTLNVNNSARSTASIVVSGGTFVGFDPSSAAAKADSIKIADGYTVTSETKDSGEVWYTVVKAD